MTEPLTIVCVKWGKRFGPFYANMLHDMVGRHLPQGSWRFQCFTDDPSGLYPDITARALPGTLTSWWNKLHLFRKDLFAPGARVAYFDLDTLIVGPLNCLSDYAGDFALLRDFYRPHGYGSGVMAWRAGACDFIWDSYESAGMPILPGGDQAWIEKVCPHADLLQEKFPGIFVSYKTDCHPLPPPGASVVCFHGEPKQDNCGAGWVRDIWKPAGMKSVPHDAAYYSLREREMNHSRLARQSPHPWLAPMPAHERHAVIIGGGPSLSQCQAELRSHRKSDHDFFATNHAASWLERESIKYDAHIIRSAEEESAAFILDGNTPCYCASTCHPAFIAKAGERTVLWQADVNSSSIDDITPAPAEQAEQSALVKGGSSTGLKAVHITFLLGYRKFHLYGFDSCCVDGAHHAYAQTASDGERIFTVELYGRSFDVAAWMLKQADEFTRFADALLQEGCSITLHGDGMLHFLATHAQQLAGSTA